MSGHADADTDIAIIGAGFGGLGAAIRLKQAGIEDFVVLEQLAHDPERRAERGPRPYRAAGV
jgi:cation diffusion facilitator CzcD-associated flavoprotein CzcO